MPTSPKFIFHNRQTRTSVFSRLRRLLSSPFFSLFSFLLALVSLVLLALAARRSPPHCTPNSSKPLSLSVSWEHDADPVTASNARSDAMLHNAGGIVESLERHKVMAFVGIQTGFRSVGRRKALRQTWFPSDRQGLLRLEEATGLAFRFVIGRTDDESKMAALRREIEEYDDFLLLDIEEKYSKLPVKTLAFFKAAHVLFDSEFYVKADDDIYLRPDRLSLLLAKERSDRQTYIGCLKKGKVFTDPKLKWYEPLSYLLGSEYFLHAYGPIYALSEDVVTSLVALRNNSFRLFSNEDVTIGAWMLAMNVRHENNLHLCEPECTSSSIAVWDIPKCSGLCNPEVQMLELHRKEECSGTPILTSE